MFPLVCFRRAPNKDVETCRFLLVVGTNRSIHLWATAEGQLGFSATPEEIHLRGGEIIVHVRDENCQAINGAIVTPYLSGSDDMSFVIPPNIRRDLQRTTNANGIVRYPSRLGDHDLGFEVRAQGMKAWTISTYSGYSECKHRLFVLTNEQKAVDRCKDRLIDELLLSDRAASYLQTGFPEFRNHSH